MKKKVKDLTKVVRKNDIIYHIEKPHKLIKIANNLIVFNKITNGIIDKKNWEIELKKQFPNLLDWTYANDITNGKIGFLAIRTTKTKAKKNQLAKSTEASAKLDKKKDKAFWKNYYRKNKKKCLLKQKKYYQNHQFKIKAKMKKYYQINKNEIIKKTIERHNKNRKKYNQYMRNYYHKIND